MATTSKRTESTFFGPWSNGTMMSPSEYEAADYERGWRYELRHGMLVVTDQLSAGESDACEHIGYLIRKFRDSEMSQRSVITLPGSVVRVDDDRLIPDRVIWLVDGRLPSQFATPTITIEFDSLRRRLHDSDRKMRRNAYSSVGVVECWIVDRFAEAVWVHSNHEAEARRRRLDRGGVLRTRLLPGFELHVGELIAEIEGWTDYERGESDRDWTPSSRY